MSKRGKGKGKTGRTNLNWAPIIKRAAEIVNEYSSSVTLRQVFYRLVSEQLIPNTESKYHYLSSETAKLRRSGEFPRLVDMSREIYRPSSFDSVSDGLQALFKQYRRNRLATQKYNVYLGIEKYALLNLLREWFDYESLTIIPTKGYTSESLERDIIEDIEKDGRPSVLLYAGDYDPTGKDIYRNFIEKVSFDVTINIALSKEQVIRYNLPLQMAKSGDPRANNYDNEQVELDALPPIVLRELYTDAISTYIDYPEIEIIYDQETEDRERLIRYYEIETQSET